MPMFASNTDYIITFNVKDFLWSLLIIALIVLVVFIILLIAKAIKNLAATHKIILMNQENITKILQNAGSISGSTDAIVKDVSHMTGAFIPSVDNIAEATETITDTFKNNNSVNEAIVKAYKVVSGANKMAKKYTSKKSNEAEKDCDSKSTDL